MRHLAPLYRLLARAVLAPPDAELLAALREVPGLPREDLDELAARHAWLFDLNVYPYASVYLDESGMLGAPWAAFAGGVLRALGLEPAPGAGLAAPDHLGALLEAVAVLLDREEAAGEAGDALAAARARHGQRTLLAEQLLPWLPLFTAALRRADAGVYGRLAELLREVALDHAGRVVGAAPARAGLPPLEDPEAAPDAVDAAAGRARGGRRGPRPAELRRLLTAARSGVFWSRADLTALGREQGLPVRFAEREAMLAGLAQSAADRDALGGLFAALAARVRAGEAERAPWRAGVPALAAVWDAWAARAEAAARELEALAEEGAAVRWREV